MSSDAQVPHFSFPFRLAAGGSFDVLEQDTLDEVSQSVEVVLMTRQGERLEVPDFGVPDLAFQVDMPYSTIRAAVDRWEPRAVATFSDDPDRLDELVRGLTAKVTMRGAS